jgi:cysteine-rich repeat protein
VVTWKRSRNGSGWTVRRDGQALTSAPIADSSFPTGVFNAFLGAEKAADGTHFGGSLTLHELHVYPQELSDADTAALERGLADAYGIGWYADGPTATPDAVLGSDLVAWYDAFDLSGANNSPVASWPNRTGNTALAASGAAQPLLATSGINGHPGVVADGVDDSMVATLNPAMPVGSRPHIWTVLRNITPRPYRTYVAVGNDGQGVNIQTDHGDPYPNWLVITLGGSGVSTPTMASAANTWPHIVSAGMAADSAEYGLKVDGISGLVTSGDPGATTVPISQVQLFSPDNNAEIGEVIISRTTPTPEMDRAVQRYLAAKWRKSPAVCGDGTVDPGEQCDDHGTAGGDGCSASCALENACTSCQSGDGCCPAGCTNPPNSDSDCDPNDPCANTESCVGGDGCCPDGCERSGDGDCPPEAPCTIDHPCGNGQAGCTSDSDCQPGLTCGLGIGPAFGQPADVGVCWDSVGCGTLSPNAADCGGIDAHCGTCCLPHCSAPGEADGCGGTCVACTPGADSDRDHLLDCDEQQDADPWTDPFIYNGMRAGLDASCHATPTCGAIDSVDEITSCFSPEQTGELSAGWSFTTTDRQSCNAGFGFDLPWSTCESNFAVGASGLLRLDGGTHCFKVTGSTAQQCGSLFVDGQALSTTGSASACLTRAAGVYPLALYYETTATSGDNDLHVLYCKSAQGSCEPTDVLPARMLRKPGDGDQRQCDANSECSALCPCSSGRECNPAAPFCAEGMECRTGVGARFGKSESAGMLPGVLRRAARRRLSVRLDQLVLRHVPGMHTELRGQGVRLERLLRQLRPLRRDLQCRSSRLRDRRRLRVGPGLRTQQRHALRARGQRARVLAGQLRRAESNRRLRLDQLRVRYLSRLQAELRRAQLWQRPLRRFVRHV